MLADSNVLAFVRRPELPRTLTLGRRSFVLRAATGDDRSALRALAASLDAEDRMVLRSDLTKAREVDRWLANIAAAKSLTLVLESRGRIVACGCLGRDYTSWRRHIGEITILVAGDHRRRGAGSALARELLEIAPSMGMSKLTARALRQRALPQEVLQRFGFRADGLLPDVVMDDTGATHDLLVLSHDTVRAAGYRDANERDRTIRTRKGQKVSTQNER